MNKFLEAGRRVIETQPFVRSLGLELTDAGAGFTAFRAPITPAMMQHLDFVHGGVILSVADTAMSFAGGTVLGNRVVTSELKVNFVRPAQGQSLVSRASVVASGKRQAVVRCEVFTVQNDLETLVALAQGTIVAASEG